MTTRTNTRRARPRPCPHCHTWILTGLDDDHGATEARADPTPLTPLGETLALLATPPRTTYFLHHRGRLELTRRDQDRIAGDPAGQGRYDVVPSHRCENGVPDRSLEPFADPQGFSIHRNLVPLPGPDDIPPF